MTLLAPGPKLPIVRIISPMAVKTTTTRFRHRFTYWCFLRVTGITLDTHMGPYQGVSSLFIVIELPSLPVPGVMATPALGA